MSGPLNDREPVISPEDIDEYLSLGYTQVDIAKMVDTTPQNISYIKRNLGRIPRDDYWKTAGKAAMESFPWKRVGKPFNQSALYKRLIDHAAYQATMHQEGGPAIPRDRLVRLRSFYEKLRDEDLVVVFHPDIRPYDGNKYGGFAYRSRTKADGKLIIRVNELAEMTETGEVVWQFPRQLPDV